MNIIYRLIDKILDVRTRRIVTIRCRKCGKLVLHHELQFSPNNKDKIILDCCVYCR